MCVWWGVSTPQSSAEQAAAPSWKPGSALGITRLLLYTPAPLHTWYSDGIALNIIEQGSAA